jgi:hypothetical protein
MPTRTRTGCTSTHGGRRSRHTQGRECGGALRVLRGVSAGVRRSLAFDGRGSRPGGVGHGVHQAIDLALSGTMLETQRVDQQGT